jgi:hypothetical protein
VSTYIAKEPAGGFTNRSNTTVSAMAEAPAIRALFGGDNAVSRVATGMLKAGAGAVKNQMAAAQAMDTNIPTKAAKLSPEQLKALTMALGFSSGIGGRIGGDMYQ